ncbi:late competence development ComFB family protein [Clostridium chromiireducens]|uniref:Competence protein n=1 Tax=Clostridium chromiireducens TaxID=225345 RepID=A0A1V4IEW8_9CLOT|nr:late competence development ComFB family protein [Clostridium chromiireducens]MVX66289.1 competence protein [Clostridium chromiireducens]OPJ58469.1 late competence development protein ComFB [Clostridium chromiireducens]RII34464.1 competence protein [Clostridium chromiireducens]
MDNVINYMEIWVREYMEVLIEKIDGCQCDKCKRDIYTLALNNLKPYYVATPLGKIMAKLESTKQQVETDIIVQVTKAINKVSINPNHDR